MRKLLVMLTLTAALSLTACGATGPSSHSPVKTREQIGVEVDKCEKKAGDDEAAAAKCADAYYKALAKLGK